MSPQSYTGINIQSPIPQRILSGDKVIETRTYPIPKKYLGETLLLIETPGTKGKFKSRIVGKIVFSRCFQYPSREAFYADVSRHSVTPNSPWAWKSGKPKWGWEIASVAPIKSNHPIKKRLGIRYTNGLVLS